MKKTLISLALAAASLLAHAETTISIVAQTCNVANTACVLQGDGGQVITVNPSTWAMNIDGVPYQGSITSATTIVSTIYRHITDVEVTFVPTAIMEAEYVMARSGSGRGGWAWHSHWVFNTITVY